MASTRFWAKAAVDKRLKIDQNRPAAPSVFDSVVRIEH